MAAMLTARLIHGICTYWRQWLVADERGFRSDNHKIHSSGDYKNPPPVDEHSGLRQFVKEHLGGNPVQLLPPEYPVVGSAFVLKLFKINAPVRCLSCGPTHVHVMYHSHAKDAKDDMAKAKQYASLQLKTRPGRIWARDCSVDHIENAAHESNLWGYILKHAKKEGAWVWRFDHDVLPTRMDVVKFAGQCTDELKLWAPPASSSR
jgi:hypothetical protein